MPETAHRPKLRPTAIHIISRLSNRLRFVSRSSGCICYFSNFEKKYLLLEECLTTCFGTNLEHKCFALKIHIHINSDQKKYFEQLTSTYSLATQRHNRRAMHNYSRNCATKVATNNPHPPLVSLIITVCNLFF